MSDGFRASIFRRFSYRVRGRWVRSPISSHASSSWPTVAHVRLNFPAATSVTSSGQSFTRRSLPTLEGAGRLAGLPGHRIVARECSELPMTRSLWPLAHGAGLTRFCPRGHSRTLGHF